MLRCVCTQCLCMRSNSEATRIYTQIAKHREYIHKMWRTNTKRNGIDVKKRRTNSATTLISPLWQCFLCTHAAAQSFVHGRALVRYVLRRAFGRTTVLVNCYMGIYALRRDSIYRYIGARG